MTNQPFKKKLENYWFYYKIHTIVAVFVIIMAAIFIKQCADNIQPDMTVLIITKNAVLPQSEITALQNNLQKYTLDVNHDGHKYVYCEVFNLNDSQNPQMLQAETAKLMAEMVDSNSALYIMDDAEYTQLNKNAGLFTKLSSILPNAPDTDKMAMSALPEAAKDFSADSDKLEFAVRAFSGSTLSSNGNKPYYDNTVTILKKLFSSSPAS